MADYSTGVVGARIDAMLADGERHIEEYRLKHGCATREDAIAKWESHEGSTNNIDKELSIEADILAKRLGWL